MRNTLNTQKLAQLVSSKRGSLGLREASAQIGNVSPSTLSRIENGSEPDFTTFLSLCDWLEIPAAQLIEIEGAQEEFDVAAYIATDCRLDEATAHALAGVVRALYAGKVP